MISIAPKISAGILWSKWYQDIFPEKIGSRSESKMGQVDKQGLMRMAFRFVATIERHTKEGKASI